MRVVRNPRAMIEGYGLCGVTRDWVMIVQHLLCVMQAAEVW